MEWHHLHHVTGVIKATVDFYTQVPGMRLVKNGQAFALPGQEK
jgi:catechol 2,3-dioxygenase-like lactoylglutathione lyase family enzyme